MVCDMRLLYKIDSMVEEVERQKSKSDMVRYTRLYSIHEFLDDKMMVQNIYLAYIL